MVRDDLARCLGMLSATLLGAIASIGVAADPSACLYDAPAASAVPLTAAGLSERAGWNRIEEDNTSHVFQGTAVLTNDKIAAVLSKDVPELAVYSRQTQELSLCALLRPVCREQSDLKMRRVAIHENTSASVVVDAECVTADGQACHISFELAAGAAFVKTTAGKGVTTLTVKSPCRFAVLPDFFGDDMVLDAEQLGVSQAQIPAENFLLQMIGGGDAILMTVAQNRDNDIRVSLAQNSPRQIESVDISYGKEPNIWVAVLADKEIWHERGVTLNDADKVIEMNWHAPYQALWRVDFSAADGMTDSWQMLLQHPEGKYVMQNWFGEDSSQGQRFGGEFGDRDWNKPGRRRWNPVLGSFSYPCWIDNVGRAFMQPLKARRYVEGGEVCNFDGPAIVYPLDRVKQMPFVTPLEKLTVVDLVRMTLGVGPCEYILDLEGQKRNSRGVATCYARDVINAIYKENTQLQRAPAIDEHLTMAVSFIRNVRERIDQYVVFSREMAGYLEEQKKRDPACAKFCDELLAITKRTDQYFESKRQAIHTPEFAQETADRFRKELLTYSEKDAFTKCEAQMNVFTSIGGAQDGLVAACRTIVKTLRQRAGIAMAQHPELTDICTEVRNRTQKMLRNPTAYEAPQH